MCSVMWVTTRFRETAPLMVRHDAWVPRALTPAEQVVANQRRETFVAALDVSGVSQAELHRRAVTAGLTTALNTIQRWHAGKSNLSIVMLREMLTLMGLPADWTPPPSSTTSP